MIAEIQRIFLDKRLRGRTSPPVMTNPSKNPIVSASGVFPNTLGTSIAAYTTAPVESAEVLGGPEFLDARGVKKYFCISRAHLYELLRDRKIKGISVRRPGASRGKRLFVVASIRNFLNSCGE